MPATAIQLQSERTATDMIRRLMDAHGPVLLASITRMVRDRALAEDIVQETLVRAWRNLEQLDIDRELAVRGWLLRVARNIAVDKFRARQSRPAEVAESAALTVGIPDPSDALVRSLQIEAALAKLCEAHRSVLRECYFHGRTLSETAKVLGIPVGTVKSRLFSALRKLREQLEDESIEF